VQQARNLSADLGVRRESLRFLPRDRDSKYSDTFDAVFGAEGLEVIKSAPRAVRMNARCERIVGPLRREALDHVLILNEARARRVLAPISGTTPHTARTRPATSYRPEPVNNPSPCRTSTAAE
jgi:putative transposase